MNMIYGDKILLSTMNPNLDIYNIDELKEILLKIESVSKCNMHFDELRSQITKTISVRETSRSRRKSSEYDGKIK